MIVYLKDNSNCLFTIEIYHFPHFSQISYDLCLLIFHVP